MLLDRCFRKVYDSEHVHAQRSVVEVMQPLIYPARRGITTLKRTGSTSGRQRYIVELVSAKLWETHLFVKAPD